MDNPIKIAIDAIRSARDECETVAVYLERMVESDTEDAAKAQYREIIADELNHALRFIFNIVVPITGITPDAGGLEESE